MCITQFIILSYKNNRNILTISVKNYNYMYCKSILFCCLLVLINVILFIVSKQLFIVIKQLFIVYKQFIYNFFSFIMPSLFDILNNLSIMIYILDSQLYPSNIVILRYCYLVY